MTISVIAAQGPNDSLVFYWQTVGSLQWNLEQVAGPGTCFSAPSVAQVGGQTVIAAQGPNDSLVFYWQTSGSGQWNPEQVSRPGYHRLGAVGRPGRELGGDRGCGPRWQPGVLLAAHRPSQWNPEQVAGPGNHFRVAASVAQVGNSTVIAALGTDGSLTFYWQTIGSALWNPEQVAGRVPPSRRRRSPRSGTRR